MNQSEIQSLLQELGNNLDDLKKIMTTTPEEKLSNKKADNIWSPKELLGHLYDAELAFHFRLKKMLETGNPALSKFDQNFWVKQHDYNQWDTHLLVNTLIALRQNLIFWLGRIPDSYWKTEGVHPERGEITFESEVKKLLSHFQHHYKQIQDRTE